MMDLLNNGPDLGMVLYGGAIGLAVIGAVGAATATHLVRIVLAIAILEAGANLLLLLAAFRFDAIAPIVLGSGSSAMVDPVPQAMVLTAIVIGVGIQAFAMTTVLKIHQRYATLDVRVLLKKLEQDIDTAAGVAPVTTPQAPAKAGIPGAKNNVEF